MSRFVAGGTIDEPKERDEAWLEAQQKIEAKRREELELAQQQGGKSLYETLQANKAAKQEQFEESIKLKNQFQSLNEDEVEFLDSVLESTRAKEAIVKKQTAEELEAFRRQKEEAERAAKAEASPDTHPDLIDTTTSWSVGKKRKKGRGESLLGGVKLRKSSTGDKATGNVPSARAPPSASTVQTDKTAVSAVYSQKPEASTSHVEAASPVSAATAKPLGLGLGAYSSDEDD